jgi:hypothetical protein
MKVRNKNSSPDSLLEYSLCCIARESGAGLGYHSSKEGLAPWPVAGPIRVFASTSPRTPAVPSSD